VIALGLCDHFVERSVEAFGAMLARNVSPRTICEHATLFRLTELTRKARYGVS